MEHMKSSKNTMIIMPIPPKTMLMVGTGIGDMPQWQAMPQAS